MKATGKPNRIDVLSTVIPLLRQRRAEKSTFHDQIRELARAIVNQNWTLFARRFNSVYQLRWGEEGLWFDDASGIAKTMFASNVKLIQFQHVPTEQLIVDFFSSLSRGTVMRHLEIGIVSGVEEINSAPIAPIDWDEEIAKLPPREEITLPKACAAAVRKALAVLADQDATPEQKAFAIVNLQILDIPLRTDWVTRQTYKPAVLTDLIARLRA